MDNSVYKAGHRCVRPIFREFCRDFRKSEFQGRWVYHAVAQRKMNITRNMRFCFVQPKCFVAALGKFLKHYMKDPQTYYVNVGLWKKISFN